MYLICPCSAERAVDGHLFDGSLEHGELIVVESRDEVAGDPSSVAAT